MNDSTPTPRLQSTRAYWLLVTVFLAVHFALRMTYPDCVEPDDADLILFSQHVAWGYTDQAPLYSWICEGLFRIFGVNVLSLTIMRTLVLAAMAWLLMRNARLLCANRLLAIFGALAVLVVPNLTWHALAYLTHTNLLLVACLVTLYAFLCILRDGSTWAYVGFGAACAMGMLSKYNFVWFAASLLLASVMVGPARRRILHPKFALAVLVGSILILPHALWILENLDGLKEILRTKVNRVEMADSTYLERVQRGLTDATTSILLIFAPIALIIALTFRPLTASEPTPAQSSPSSSDFRAAANQVLNWFFLFALLFVFLQITVLGVSRFHERWLQPFAVVLPLWLMGKIDPSRLTAGRTQRFAALLIVLAFGYTAARAVQVFYFPDYPRGWYPIRTDYHRLVEEIQAEVGNAPTIVTPEREIGGNLLLQMPQANVICTYHALYPVSRNDGPLVIVWNLELTRGFAAVPWLMLPAYAKKYGTAPLPPERIHRTEIAPAAWGKPPTTLLWVVFRD